MMPYIQGESASVPDEYKPYAAIIDSVFHKKGDVGYLTIDESLALAGKPHRGTRAKSARALHTEVGRDPAKVYYRWGGSWGGKDEVILDGDVEILLANNVDDSCAIWNASHPETSLDGDIGHESGRYPYKDAVLVKSGEVHKIGILTPHESLPVRETCERQFLRIISSGVHGREPYFTMNPLVVV